MTKPSNVTTKQTGRKLVITRTFDAPRELVWKAWTEPERFMRWWGPKIFTSPRCEIDLRVEGRFLWCMRWPDGRENYTTGEYVESSLASVSSTRRPLPMPRATPCRRATTGWATTSRSRCG